MNERIRDVVNLSNLNSSLERIIVNYKDLQKFFNEIQRQFEDNQLIFYVYCCYLKNIIGDDILANHLIKLLKDYKDNKDLNLVDSDYFKMSIVEEIGLIITSCNSLEMGKIKWCNNKISTLLGFSSAELKKNKINRIIPPAISQKHNSYIKKWVESYKSTFINKTRVTFFINNSNYLMPFILYLKLLPTIVNGIEVCAMLY